MPNEAYPSSSPPQIHYLIILSFLIFSTVKDLKFTVSSFWAAPYSSSPYVEHDS